VERTRTVSDSHPALRFGWPTPNQRLVSGGVRYSPSNSTFSRKQDF
jgi:hypothetical protein